jgi:hypothetical protein
MNALLSLVAITAVFGSNPAQGDSEPKYDMSYLEKSFRIKFKSTTVRREMRRWTRRSG